MKRIDLTLKKIDDDKKAEECTLTNVINSANNIIILLGSAGSGKTSILKKFLDENTSTSEFFTIKAFLKLNHQVSQNKKVLLLDGLDEYRHVESDRTFVVQILANKLANIEQGIKIVISCREMDWYGEKDTQSLKDTLNQKVDLYQILPLDYEQKITLSTLLGVEDEEEFVGRYEQYGFLENPQMLKMLADIEKTSTDVITNKTELYEKFIDSSLESNTEYTLNGSAPIDQSDIYKYAGYIAFYTIFCSIDKFDDTFVDSIVNNEKAYLKDKIQRTLSTKLFNEKNFIHRTIAEFLLAKFIINKKFSTDISEHRVKNRFAIGGVIPTELKGSFSWLCSLSQDLEIIKIDPYYQCSHGDNAAFNNELKKEVILEVKKQSETNPYFMNFGDRNKLQGFYNPQLDDFLMEELEASLQLKNHYFAFLHSIINTKEISAAMQIFLKKLALSPLTPSYDVAEIVKLIDDKAFLRNILDKVKNNAISDTENGVKQSILKILYPNNITHKEIAPYLLCYKKDNYAGNYQFLYKTNYRDKKALLDEIHKNGNLSSDLEYFFYDYLAETVSKFEDELTAKDIYQIISHFRKYYDKHKRFRIESFRTPVSNWLNSNEEKITKLANELFTLYINDLLKETKENGYYCFHYFKYFFLYGPNNQVNISLDAMSERLDEGKNTALLHNALSYLPKDINNETILLKKVEEKVKLLHLEDALDSWLNPKKLPFEIKQEERERQQQKKDGELLKKNEIYLKNQSDKDIQTNLNILFDISTYLYFGRDDVDNVIKKSNLTKKTFNRVKNILKDAVFKPLIDPNLLTISSLVKNSINAEREIDMVYYVSCALNQPKEIEQINNPEFLKYLYINSLAYGTIGNIIINNYYKYIEEYNLNYAITTLKEYIKIIIDTHAKTYFDVIMPYIDSEDGIRKLKKIIDYMANENTQASVLSNFINTYHFNINLNDLKKLQSQESDKDRITALIILLSSRENDFTSEMAIALSQMLGLSWRDSDFSVK